jgi:hypothetical protein
MEYHSEHICEDRSNASKHEKGPKPNPERREDELHYFEHRKFLNRWLTVLGLQQRSRILGSDNNLTWEWQDASKEAYRLSPRVSS